MSEEILNFAGAAIGYGKKKILNNMFFTIYENDFIGIVGPNGAGKSTLLKTIMGSIKPLEGVITKNSVRFGYVPQGDVVRPLLPYTVYDVVLMGRYSLMGTFGNPTKEDKEIVKASLDKVGICDLINHNYNDLSGGQKQRTLIARALAVEPNMLILDEPTNGMDTPSHYALLNLIYKLHEDTKVTVLLVSHLLSDVANYVKKLLLIEKNKFQFGPIEEILSKENLETTYSSEFSVERINNEYYISSKNSR